MLEPSQQAKTASDAGGRRDEPMNLKALVAEFIGTFALIFIGVGAITANYLTAGDVGLTGIALAH